MGPSFGVVGVGQRLPESRPGDEFGEGGVRGELVVKGWVLARGFDAVGEDGEVDGFGLGGSVAGRVVEGGGGGGELGACWGHSGGFFLE